MAGIHIARVGFFSVNSKTGKFIDKNHPDTKIRDVLRTEHQHRVIADVTNAPNSVDNPTVDDYLRLEAAAGYILRHMDQTMIVTYSGI